jgi:methylmalonyl-CoA mutase cobalamin-binding domain/chain
MTRPGRIVIGTLGLDQHEVGAMAISQLLVRHGYEVVYLGRFNTPHRLAAVAKQEDADLVPGARDVTGRVIEVGNGRISVPDGWRPAHRTRCRR